MYRIWKTDLISDFAPTEYILPTLDQARYALVSNVIVPYMVELSDDKDVMHSITIDYNPVTDLYMVTTKTPSGKNEIVIYDIREEA